jgi:flagellar biosynthesis protein
MWPSVPLFRELVSLLKQADLNAHIAPTLYIAVAEVLAWVYKIEGRAALPAPRCEWLRC